MSKPFIILLFLPFFLISQPTVKYPTLLWKISGKGLKKPSYLYGTMHVSNRAAYYLSEEFFEALKSVDVVGLETNPGEWMENMESTGELSELNQFNSGSYYNRNFYKSTFVNTLPSQTLLKSVLSYEPDIINGLLYRQHNSRENFEENTYIDLFIYQSASKLNKKVISLEDFAQSEIYARLAALPDEYGEDYGELDYKDYQSIGQKTEDAYREGNLSKLDSLSRISSTGNTIKYLIKERNFFFVRSIDSVLQTQSLFSGVGAAHLPGDFGVIEMLREKGYTLEPVFPKFTDKSIRMRQNLDAKFKKVEFKKYTAPDSAFSVNLPGKLYPVASIDNLKYYLHADMVNGSYYSVTRLKYLGPLYQESRFTMEALFDKLFFENIPGKILSKKEISDAAGYGALDILSVTRQGDQQRYHIYFNDLEIFIFKLGGKSNYASGSEADQFFKSIQFTQKPQGITEYLPDFKFTPVYGKALTWNEFTPPSGGFTCSVPEGFNYEKFKGSPLNGVTEDLFAYDPFKKVFGGIKHAVFNDFNYLEVDSFELNQFAKNTLENYQYDTEPSYQITREQNLPCIYFKGKNKNKYNMCGKVYIKGVHYYMIYLVSQSEPDLTHPFFSSFRLGDFNYIHTKKFIRDKDFYFKAKDEISDDAQSRFNEAYAKVYAKNIQDKIDSSSDYEVRVDSKYYYSPSSNECVNIILEKYNDYDYRDPKEMEEKVEKRYKNSFSCTLHRKEWNKQKDAYKIRYVLKDTATTRQIESRLYIKQGLLMEIVAPYDSLIGLKGWTKDFMETFELLDTLPGKNIFVNKFGLLLNDLCSEDTLLRRKANNSLKNSITLQKCYVPEFVKFLGSGNLAKVNEDSKAQLFVNGGVMKSEDIIAPYKTTYKQYTDSFYLQLCLLKGLAYLKTQRSYDAFYDLVIKETPLVGSEVTVNDVFSTLHDSIELCKKFFPGLLSITHHNEYREAVYSLLSELMNKGVISPTACAANKEAMLTDANLCLKRYNPALVQGNFQGNNPNGYNALDKNSKELAENLQVSLEGMNNNRLHKGSNYLRMLDAFNRQPLVNYAIVLAPYYKQDEKVRTFFGKIAKIKQQNILMPVHIALLKRGIVLSDTLSEHYSRNKFTRAFFYSELEKAELIDKFDARYASQLHLVESVLAIQRQLNSFYGNERDKMLKDSLNFVKELPVMNKYEKGKLFLFKNQKLGVSDQKWSMVFVENKTSINSNMEVYSLDFEMDHDKTMEENERIIQDYFYLGYRNRANMNTSN